MVDIGETTVLIQPTASTVHLPSSVMRVRRMASASTTRPVVAKAQRLFGALHDIGAASDALTQPVECDLARAPALLESCKQVNT